MVVVIIVIVVVVVVHVDVGAGYRDGQTDDMRHVSRLNRFKPQITHLTARGSQSRTEMNAGLQEVRYCATGLVGPR